MSATQERKKNYCSFMDGQHKCNHRFRLVLVNAAYESWWKVYEHGKLVYEGVNPNTFMHARSRP